MYDALTIETETPHELDRWRPLAQWLMALPHLIVAGAMEYLAAAVGVVSWFVILVTGRLPAGLANVQVMIMRYTARAQLYAGFLYDQYPPFDFTASAADPGGSPVVLEVRPELENRDRLSVGLRLLWAVPAVLYALVIAVVGFLAWIGAFFAIIATGRWPESLRQWAGRAVRVTTRTHAYVLLLTDTYPPFSTE